jgi:DNA-binding MarR family transcriptional regulator
MALEDDIQQVRFRNDKQKAIINLIYTYNWVRDKMQAQIAEHDLTMQQYNILRILRGAKKPLSTLQIRERMLDKMSDTSRIVDRLILKKLVKKEICKGDKRLVDVLITDSGLEKLAQLDEISIEMDNILGSLNANEAFQLNELLDKIRLSETVASIKK